MSQGEQVRQSMLSSITSSIRTISRSLFSPSALVANSTTISVSQYFPLLDLPPEIRRLIWEHVFGPATYHIVQGKDRDTFVHIRCLHGLKCTEHGLPILSSTCFTAKANLLNIDSNDLRFFSLRGTIPWGKLGHAKLGLLSTSRQVRREATDVFWSANCIEIYDISLLVKFVDQLDPLHLSMIRTLRLHFPTKASIGPEACQYICSDQTRLDVCNALKKMPALTQLRIAFEDPRLLTRLVPRITTGGPDSSLLTTIGEQVLPEDLVDPEQFDLLEGIRRTSQRHDNEDSQSDASLSLALNQIEDARLQSLIRCVIEVMFGIRCDARPHLTLDSGTYVIFNQENLDNRLVSAEDRWRFHS